MIAAIQILQSMGYAVSLERDQIVLKYDGHTVPDSAVVEPLMEEIRQHKSAVIALLKTDPHFHWEAVENDTDTTYQQNPGEVRQDESCYACKRFDFWDKAGQRICSICHPQLKIPTPKGEKSYE